MAESTTKLEAGKIFVGGLSWDTSKENLVKYFTKYGEVSDGVIMVDSVTKMPRGFGFITFKDHASVASVIDASEQHFLDGKKIDPKEAITKDQHANSQLSKSSSIDKKVFVGGLPHGCGKEDLKEHFKQYGNIVEVDVKTDKTTNKPRGFAFIEYDNNEAASEAIKQQFQRLSDKNVEVKRAEDRISGGASSQSTQQGQSYTGQFSQGQTLATAGAQVNPYHYPYVYAGYSQPTYQAAGPNYPSQTTQTYQPPHVTGAQGGYTQPSSYQPNGYQQPYVNVSSSAYHQTYSSGHTHPGTYAGTGYPAQYPATYQAATDSGASSYEQSLTSSSYYTNPGYHQQQQQQPQPQQQQSAYPPSDSRYFQNQNQNQRNW